MSMGAQWTRERLTERLLTAAPTVGPHLVVAMSPAVRLASLKTSDDEIQVGHSKFGGSPDLPRGSSWPAWTNRVGRKRAMQFFAQVDLGLAADAAPGSLQLPRQGLLSMFADFDPPDDGGIQGRTRGEQNGMALVYSPPESVLARLTPPLPSLPAARLSAVPVWTWPQDAPPGVTVPDSEFDELDELDMEYEASLRTVRRRGYQSGRHQLGGHARYALRPVEEQVVRALNTDDAGSLDIKTWEASRHQVKDWRVVVQIDSDESLGVMWSDGGTLYWAMRQQDLDAARWDRAMLNFQCS